MKNAAIIFTVAIIAVLVIWLIENPPQRAKDIERFHRERIHGRYEVQRQDANPLTEDGYRKSDYPLRMGVQ